MTTSFWYGIFWPYFQFVVFIVFIIYVARKPIHKYLESKRDEFRTKLSEAKEALTLAERKIHQYESQLSALTKEVQDIKNQYKQDTALEKEKILQEANKTAESVLNDAKRAALELVAQTQNDLKDEMFKQVLAEFQKQLTSEKVSQLEAELHKEVVRSIPKYCRTQGNILMEKFSGPLSRRYGTALFESLHDLFGNKKEELAKSSELVRELSKLINKKTVNIFKNQALSIEQKKVLLNELLNKSISSKASKQLHELLFNFLLLIIKNKRFSLIHSILEFYLKLADESLGIIRASITSARTMAPDMVQEFESSISHAIQKKVVFSNFIDESLQCGFLIKIGALNIDASLKSFLTKLKESVH